MSFHPASAVASPFVQSWPAMGIIRHSFRRGLLRGKNGDQMKPDALIPLLSSLRAPAPSPRRLVKTQTAGSQPQNFWSEGLGCLRNCISYKPPGDVDVAGLGTVLGDHSSELTVLSSQQSFETRSRGAHKHCDW